MLKNTLVVAALVAVTAGVFYGWWFFTQPATPVAPQASAPIDSDASVPATAGAGNTSTDQTESVATQLPETPNATSAVQDNATNSGIASGAEPVAITDYPDIFTIGKQPISDERFRELVAQLNKDPAFMQAMMDEFRAETDPKRLNRLSQLLGEIDNPALTSLAADMVYSGNEASQTAALDLLRRVQQRDPAARELVIDLLSSESSSAVLVGALNVLSTPVETSDDQRQRIVNQITPLLENDNELVRQRGLGTLARWSKDPSITDMLLRGLRDSDPNVRKTAAYALVDHPDNSAQVRQALFSVLENSDESARARRGSALALHARQLDAFETSRLAAAERDLNKRN